MKDVLTKIWDSVIGSLLAVVIGFGLVGVGLRAWDHNLSVKKCEQFNASTGFATKFVDWNFFNYECLVQNTSGRWIPLNQLRNVD